MRVRRSFSKRPGSEELFAIEPSPLGDNITYIKTYEGFPCLAVVIDLYSRRVIG